MSQVVKRYYWKMHAKMAKQAMAEIDKERESMKIACNLAKRCGGTGKVYTSRSLGCLSVHGFAFRQPPDPKLWRKLKGTDDGYAPRRCRANSLLLQEMKALRGEALQTIENLIAHKDRPMLAHEDGGVRWLSLGVRIVKRQDVYVDAPASWKLRGCRRISDVEFERAVRNGVTG